MLDTLTQVDSALALAIGDAAACEYQPAPWADLCGARATWVGHLACGCRRLACTPHRAAVDACTQEAREVALHAALHGHTALIYCMACQTRLLDLTITWEPI